MRGGSAASACIVCTAVRVNTAQAPHRQRANARPRSYATPWETWKRKYTPSRSPRGKRGAREGVPKFSLDKSPRACYTKRKATGDDLHRLAHSYFLSVLNITRKRAECQTFCSFFAHLWRFSFKNTIFYEHLFYFLADS